MQSSVKVKQLPLIVREGCMRDEREVWRAADMVAEVAGGVAVEEEDEEDEEDEEEEGGSWGEEEEDDEDEEEEDDEEESESGELAVSITGSLAGGGFFPKNPIRRDGC